MLSMGEFNVKMIVVMWFVPEIGANCDCARDRWVNCKIYAHKFDFGFNENGFICWVALMVIEPLFCPRSFAIRQSHPIRWHCHFISFHYVANSPLAYRYSIIFAYIHCLMIQSSKMFIITYKMFSYTYFMCMNALGARHAHSLSP